jgi:hypothetical protein
METVPINWLALIVVAIVKFAIGAAWYAPQIFGKQWQAELGMTQEQVRANMVPALVAEAITDLVLAFFLIFAVRYAGANTLLQGAFVGFLVWLGFVATLTIPQVYYERRSWRLWSINNGYLVVSLIVMGAILGVWQ